MGPLKFYCDNYRHLVCKPYTLNNLHAMARILKIKPKWFHGRTYPHYDIPKKRIEEIKERCTVISSKDLLRICRGEYEGD